MGTQDVDLPSIVDKSVRVTDAGTGEAASVEKPVAVDSDKRVPVGGALFNGVICRGFAGMDAVRAIGGPG